MNRIACFLLWGLCMLHTVAALAQGPFAHTYMITNRANPSLDTSFKVVNDTTTIVPLPPGELSFYTAPGTYNQEAAAFDAESMQTFRSRLLADLRKTANNGVHSISVFIHGLDNAWPNALKSVGEFGGNIRKQGYEHGLVIGFSWPSYGSEPGPKGVDKRHIIASINEQLDFYARTYIQTRRQGSIRNNIHGSRESFVAMLQFLFGLKAELGKLRVNLIAHSEGNFMTMIGMNHANARPNPLQGQRLDQVVLLAADINNGALEAPTRTRVKAGHTGDGGSMADLSRFVSAYYSHVDEAVFLADLFGYLRPVHNPIHRSRMGNAGPARPDHLHANVAGVNTTAILNPHHLHFLVARHVLPAPVSVHHSYFAVPQVLADIALTLDLNPDTPEAFGTRKQRKKNIFCLRCTEGCAPFITICR